MNKVTTVNLNGRAYQIEEQGYEALRTYLDEAARLLSDDPDRDEIMADLEQAIAEKGARYLGSNKNVLTAGETQQILREMGPVEPGAASAAETAEATAPSGSDARSSASQAPRDSVATPKRLYQIREGAMISGVCNGLAAYFGMDPTVVRLIFVLLAFLTSGGWLLVYLVMMFVVPFADTPEQRAAARGLPFNAQQLVEQAKRHYAQIKSGHERWRARRQRSRERQFWRPRAEHTYEPPHARVHEPRPAYGAQLAAGVMLPVLGIVSALLTVIWIFALVSLLTTGEVFGWPLPDGMPSWVGVLALIFAYAAVNWPLRAARYASYQANAHERGWFVMWDSLLWLGMVVLLSWLAYRHFPEVRDFIRDLPDHWNLVALHLGRVFA